MFHRASNADRGVELMPVVKAYAQHARGFEQKLVGVFRVIGSCLIVLSMPAGWVSKGSNKYASMKAARQHFVNKKNGIAHWAKSKVLERVRN